jgi:hypothetical protein
MRQEKVGCIKADLERDERRASIGLKPRPFGLLKFPVVSGHVM